MDQYGSVTNVSFTIATWWKETNFTDVDGTPDSLYEFGYGKTYSTLTYSNLTLPSKTATAKDTMKATVRGCVIPASAKGQK